MPLYQLTLLKRELVAKDILVFTFEKPQDFTFKPGQYGGFTLINPKQTDQLGITRRFSLLSCPGDADLTIATRINHPSSAYKEILQELPIGSQIKFAGPAGNFTLHDDFKHPAVMIAGGIGITPFYSMIHHVSRNQFPLDIYLFYGCQDKDAAAFLDELLQLEAKNPRFKLIPTLAAPTLEWQGETGWITKEMIKKYIPDLSTPIYYICGAPLMVTTLQETLVEMDIDEDKIKVEDFPGY